MGARVVPRDGPPAKASEVSQKRVRCIFCDRVRPQSIEHVVPRWVEKVLGGTPPFTTEYFDDIRGHEPRTRTAESQSLTQLRLPGVCSTCNNEWMSGLERAARPLLTRLIRGEPTALSPTDRRLVSTWGQLKCISVDALYGGNHEGIRHLPPVTAHAFAQELQPISNSSVVIGRFEPPSVGVMLPWTRHMGNIAPSYEHPAMNLVTVTIALGYFMVKVVIGAWAGEFPPQARLARPQAWALPCWPLDVDRSYQWPPTRSVIGLADFQDIGSNRTRGLPPPPRS